MPSFDAVNYSLRPSKSIQRHLVFQGIAKVGTHISLERAAYIGFGSIWFTDFVLAHQILGIDDMISIEGNEIGYRRAVFNSPYATVSVRQGLSSEVLPLLYRDPALRGRPWVVWLDYDYEFNEAVKDDVVSVIENAPENSILLATFNGHEMKYGAAPDRPERLRQIFGAVVPDDLSKNACKDVRMQETLANLTRDLMQSTASEIGRPGGFIPAFRIIYRDGAPMVTVGGILPSRGAAGIAADVVSAEKWRCRPLKPIVAPHLTIREAAALQRRLPSGTSLNRDIVRQEGFDLDDEQIEAFESYYRHYPAFAQIIA